MIKHSATLAVNEKIESRRAAGLPVLHLGFGEAGLPVPAEVTAALAEAAPVNSYPPVAGSADARRAVADYCTRRGLPTEADRTILAPGSKALLYAALAALPGDLLLPVPSWVSYAAQAQLTGKRVIGVPIPECTGGVPDPERLERVLVEARDGGADPRIVILTLPDNPTGTRPGAEHVERVCALAEHYGLVIIADEIYRDLAHDPSVTQVSPATLLPERTVVTGGLSKNMALGGWRIGFARLPDGPFGHELRERLIGIASEVWSGLPAPMQAVASYVLDEPEPVVEHVAAARRLHSIVAGAVCDVFTAAGALCRPPTAAFYCYPDLEPLRPQLRARGLRTGAELAEHLLERHGVGVLAGEHFGDAPEAHRFRVATSLLYGETPERRWEALRSSDPLALPWIDDALARLRSVLATLG